MAAAKSVIPIKNCVVIAGNNGELRVFTHKSNDILLRTTLPASGGYRWLKVDLRQLKLCLAVDNSDMLNTVVDKDLTCTIRCETGQHRQLLPEHAFQVCM
jgi:hypothetical protein